MATNKLARRGKKDSKEKKPSDIVLITFYGPRSVHRMLKIAAAQKGLSLSAEIMSRIFAVAPVQNIGGIVTGEMQATHAATKTPFPPGSILPPGGVKP